MKGGSLNLEVQAASDAELFPWITERQSRRHDFGEYYGLTGLMAILFFYGFDRFFSKSLFSLLKPDSLKND